MDGRKVKCGQSDEDSEYSKNQFANAKSMKEFLEIWSKFYVNEICIPTYGGNFYGDEDTDNHQATLELGKTFQKITLNGLIPIESQAMVPGFQKEFIEALGKRTNISILAKELNRFNNIVAYWNEINVDESAVNDFYVTYDPGNKKIDNKKMVGRPVTFLESNRESIVSLIRQWLSEDVKSELIPKKYTIIHVVNASFDTPDGYMLDCILQAQHNVLVLTDLVSAVKKGDITKARAILKKYPNTNVSETFNGRDLVMIAIKNASSEDEMFQMVSLLIDHDANVMDVFDSADDVNKVPPRVAQLIIKHLPPWYVESYLK